jgi:hypothetical protein
LDQCFQLARLDLSNPLDQLDPLDPLDRFHP